MRMIDPRLFGALEGRSRLLWTTIILGAAAALATVAQAFELARIVDAVFLRGAGLAEVRSSLAILALWVVVRAALVTIERIAAHSLGTAVVDDLSHRTIAHLERVGPVGLTDHRVDDLQTVLSEGARDLRSWFSDYLPRLALAAIVPLTILIPVLHLDPLSALVLGLTAPVIPVFMALIGSAAGARARDRFTALSRMTAFFKDTIEGLTTLNILGRVGERIEAVRRVTEDMRRTTMEVLRLAFLSALALELIATLSTAVVAVEIGLRLLSGRLDFTEAFFVLLLAPEFYLPLRLLGQKFHTSTAGVAAADRFFELLSLPVTRPVSRDSGRPAPPDPLTVALHDVHLRYPGRTGEALCGVDITLRRGETVALVGPSGAGKSSIVNLLLQFIEPTSGSLTIDGIPFDEIDPDSWRRRIAWVPQEPHLLSTTVTGAIRTGRPEATDAEVRTAARNAGADQFIERLPGRWNATIGVQGARLSGGEVRRLALARAFLRDAPILILDEPGTGLDPESLETVERATRDLARGRMVLIIAHRLSTVRRADRIVVLDRGTVVETGEFDRLRGAGGLFASMLCSLEAPS